VLQNMPNHCSKCVCVCVCTYACMHADAGYTSRAIRLENTVLQVLKYNN
jgi:hypothetical protein